MRQKKFYVTTAIDYVNDVIHIGHAYQKILADALARFYRQIGVETFFLTGTDEHGSKTQKTAEKQGISPQELADRISAANKKQLDALNLSYDRFIRTTDEDHRQMVTKFYRKLYEKGDIYEGTYTGLYCSGCEEFLKERDLVNGRCPFHPQTEPVKLSEKNYFFRWSRYESFLREKLEQDPDFLRPESRRREMLALLDRGLEDKAFTRPKESVSFGIEVPHDPSQVIYVWADALVNYITGNPKVWEDSQTYIVHILGKDNVTFHALLWPAMLKSAGYRLPDTIYGHDFFTLNGQRISKSLGNIIRPTELVSKFGTDAVRYFFLRYGPLRDDVDVTLERITRVYNADLANGLGNLVSRVVKMGEHASFQSSIFSFQLENIQEFRELKEQLENFRVDLALGLIWQKISRVDKYIDHHRVWEQKGRKQEESLRYLVRETYEIAMLLEPFLPETAERIKKQLQSSKIESLEPLFPRIG